MKSCCTPFAPGRGSTCPDEHMLRMAVWGMVLALHAGNGPGTPWPVSLAQVHPFEHRGVCSILRSRHDSTAIRSTEPAAGLLSASPWQA